MCVCVYNVFMLSYSFILCSLLAVIMLGLIHKKHIHSFIFGTPVLALSLSRTQSLSLFVLLSCFQWWSGGGYFVFIYCWSYSMYFTCGNSAIHKQQSAERTEQWKLIESINENMNNEGGSFTFSGAIFGMESTLFVYVCVHVCVCVYERVLLCVGCLTLFFNVRACACVNVGLCS